MTQERQRKMTFLFVKRMSYTYKCVIDEYYLTIAILTYRTLIKVNWTKQEQIKETPLKILDESNNYFLY